MLKEFIQELRDNLLRTEWKMHGDPRQDDVTYAFNPSTGQTKEYYSIPAPVTAEVKTLDDIWTFIGRLETPLSPYVFHENDSECLKSIWIDDTQVFAFIDTNRKAPACVMPITLHHAVDKLQRLCLESWRSHADFLAMLKNDLYGVSFGPEGFINIVQSVKFESASSTQSELSGVGDSSISKSAISKVTGTAQIPEEVSITFNPLPGLKEVSLKSTVRCAVFADSIRAGLRLIPRPGEMDQLRLDIRNAIKKALMDSEISDESTPVLFGKVR